MYFMYLEVIQRAKLTSLLSNESEELCAAELVETLDRFVPVEAVHRWKTGVDVVTDGAVGAITLTKVASRERCRQVVGGVSTHRIRWLREADVHKDSTVVGAVHGDLSGTEEVRRLPRCVSDNNDSREPRHDQVGYAGDEDGQ